MATEYRATTTDLTLTNAADPTKSEAVPNAVVLPGVIITVIAPPALLARLGLAERHHKNSVMPGGVRDVAVHAPAGVAIGGRDCVVEPVAGSDGGPVMVGQVVLEQLGWQPDPETGGLVGVQSPA